MTGVNSEALDFRFADDHGYILSRGNHLASARLNLQHFLYQQVLKFTIHPKIAEQLPEEPLVADVAAGTMLWTLEASHEFPKAQLHAYDVDFRQAPPPAWLPNNVSLSEWDMFEDPPADLLGRYDLVHIRLLVLVLSGLDPIPVIQRFKSLLKPGGWLQWEDVDNVRMHVKKTGLDIPTPSLDALLETSHSGGRHNWLVKLPEMLTELGFVDAEMQLFDDPVELCRAFNDQHMMMMEEFAAGLAKLGKTEAAERVLALIRGAYLEMTNGAGLCYPKLCCIAKKVT